MSRLHRRLIPAVSAFAALVAVAARVSERPSEQALREMLRDILASGYQLTPPVRVRIEEWLIWLLDRLRGLFGPLTQSGPLAGLPPWASYLVAGILTVLLLLIIAHIAVTVRRALAEPPVVRGTTRAEFRREDPRSLLAAAEAALREGDWDLAVRLLYRAALRRLDRAGLLTHDPARTNWENLRALRSEDPDLRQAMTSLARAVDDTVYGGLPASRATAEDCRAAVATLWRAEAAG